ncbi:MULTISPECIES: Holliday junction branch migration protein RuvA [Flavobacteriaceae]|jgi:Holliday junction DNA helicase RuvA|uniref:Holliday junction branch migration protein RuvA n=1 Tax=Flavobacteriaceae TaxID=49546 RepID=UPI000C8AD2C5|nr:MULTISPECIES: Holliday junction branch migration protein RuvA [Flavobacteriaceae]MAB47029.1 Holliday junction branch migration protein RuvA [Flavobacteriaceae bacterium]|tara:strand:- start:346 stop:927 length:582 start_codon:yes stop_codon:yes gene_type:complete
MITHLEGKLVEKNPTDVVIDCNGVGYFVNISLHTFSQIPDRENLKLYTYLQVREDAHSLYGFSSKAEREIFKLLISVSGIGTNTARTMLSSLTPEQVKEGIAGGDVALIQSVKGIGAKTAQRVIIDLKDKVLKVYGIDELSLIPNNTNKDEALSALDVLGFNKKQSEKVVDKILQAQPDALVEQIIKEALKNL